MHVLRFTTPSQLEWRRVGAFSTSVALHLAALALVLMPLAPPLQRSLQHAIDVTFVEAPPPPPRIPPPPEPEPLRKPPPRATAPSPRQPPPTSPAVAQVPSPAAMPPAASSPPAIDAIPTAQPSAPSGETRRLSYDGDLRLRYPASSARTHEEGIVLLRVLVDGTGRVERVEIERSSGHPRLDAAAREAVLRGRFKPVLIEGRPTSAWGLVPIEFRLDRA